MPHQHFGCRSDGRSLNTYLESGFSLIGPRDLDVLLKGKATNGFVLLEAHFSAPDHPLQHERFPHISGAIQVHPSYFEAGLDFEKYYPQYTCPEDSKLLAYGELALALKGLGISPEKPVIVYGTDPDAPMSAARVVWALLVAGVADVRLLDGGIAAWQAFGGPTVEYVAEPQRFVSRIQDSWVRRSEYLATQDDLRTEGAKLIDVRSLGEFDGSDIHHYPFLSKAGPIPGAVHQGDWQNFVEPGTGKLAPMLEPVKQWWLSLGIDGANSATLIFYCGTGWRSSIAFLVAHLLGYRAKNYDGGYYDWSCE